MGLNAIKEVVPGLLGGIGVTPKNLAVLALVERELAAFEPHLRLVGFKNNRIYVEVDSSVLLHECTYKRRELLRALENTFPLETPPEIKFFLSGLARADARDRHRRQSF